MSKDPEGMTCPKPNNLVFFLGIATKLNWTLATITSNEPLPFLPIYSAGTIQKPGFSTLCTHAMGVSRCHHCHSMSAVFLAVRNKKIVKTIFLVTFSYCACWWSLLWSCIQREETRQERIRPQEMLWSTQPSITFSKAAEDPGAKHHLDTAVTTCLIQHQSYANCL